MSTHINKVAEVCHEANGKLKHIKSKSAKGWDDAINEAERQLLIINSRAARLRKVIEDFKELKASGHPWPSNPATQN